MDPIRTKISPLYQITCTHASFTAFYAPLRFSVTWHLPQFHNAALKWLTRDLCYYRAFDKLKERKADKDNQLQSTL